MIEVRICKNVGERSSTSWFYWVRVYHMCRIGMHTIIGLFRRTFPIHYTLNRYLTKISLYQNVCFTQYEENVTFSFLGSTFIVNPPIRVPRIETLTRLLAIQTFVKCTYIGIFEYLWVPVESWWIDCDLLPFSEVVFGPIFHLELSVLHNPTNHKDATWYTECFFHNAICKINDQTWANRTIPNLNIRSIRTHQMAAHVLFL